MKMKRILVTLARTDSPAVDTAVKKILNRGFAPCFWKSGTSSIYNGNGHPVAEGVSPPMQNNNWPAKFVLELPAYLVRKGVPEYTGPIKGDI
jgi:hypothetical protein